MEERKNFHKVVEELARLLNQLPAGRRWSVEQELLGSLNRMVQLLASLEAEKSELERMIAILEAEVIVADKGDDG